MNAPVRIDVLLTPEEVAGGTSLPAVNDLVSELVAQYREARAKIGEVAAFSQGEACRAVIHYFLEGNASEDRGRQTMLRSAEQLFQEGGAVAWLNAAYWGKALALTDVYDAMPQERRNEWNAQMRQPQGVRKHRGDDAEWETPPLPDFEEETVRATLQDLLGARATFLAERVDGIFRALSGEHVTNSRAAFGKRMIVAHLISSYGTTNHDRVGYINDLRCVVAKFMGRDEPPWNATSSVVDYARRSRRGEWVTLDGGALRLRAYNCGTCHLEVHPDMAWRLNCVLAHLYPMAIPPEFRAKPKRRPKNFVMMGRPLPFKVIAALEAMERAVRFEKNTGPDAWRNEYRRIEIPNALQFRYGASDDKAIREEAERVLAYLGGVKIANDRGGHYYAFDYRPRAALDEIVASGCLPDQKAHQYYPTPSDIAQTAVELADIGAGDTCLEPSAGTGAIADLLPAKRTHCVEVSALHCQILQAKGHSVTQADFLRWNVRKFNRIVMNPPFSGRWQAHVEQAASLLAEGGRLVAILPASARRQDVLPGWTLKWTTVRSNAFSGTSIDVVILAATPPLSGVEQNTGESRDH